MSEQSEELKKRTSAFALNVLQLIEAMPRGGGGDVLGRQLAKSATSVGANYRAACNARSRTEFIAKLCIVVEEADESVYWLELATKARYVVADSVKPVHQEAIELRAIFARSLGTARANLAASRHRT